jgi:hypothetical protein
MKVTIRGVEIVHRGLQQVEHRLGAAVRRWAFGEGLEVIAFSQRLVPVDTGALKASAHVEAPVQVGRRIFVALGYGGPAVTYALRVHEDLRARHKEGQEAKFLEKGFIARLPVMPGTLREVMREATER